MAKRRPVRNAKVRSGVILAALIALIAVLASLLFYVGRLRRSQYLHNSNSALQSEKIRQDPASPGTGEFQILG